MIPLSPDIQRVVADITVGCPVIIKLVDWLLERHHKRAESDRAHKVEDHQAAEDEKLDQIIDRLEALETSHTLPRSPEDMTPSQIEQLARSNSFWHELATRLAGTLPPARKEHEMYIVAQHFTPQQFRDYVEGLHLGSADWRGDFVVLHNTGAPTIAEAPEGITAQRIQNLKSYYEGLGWHAGPHCFCDQNGIWAFSPLTAPGVHSPSWNHISYGIEQLGDFDTEAYDSGPGAQIRDNAVACVAIICQAAGIDSHTLRFHKEDPETDHKDCPGANCVKPDFIQAVHDYIANVLT